jgi:hypothetical protein
MFPALFCVANDHTSVAIFRARRVRDRAFEVAPYKIFHGSNGAAMPEEAYAMDGRFGGHPSHFANTPVVLVAENDIVFEGRWVHSGTTVFSMYCGTAIPMLTFLDRPGDWADRFTNDYEHFLPVIEGTRRDVRTWAGRWNPISWIRPEDEEGGGARGSSPIRSGGGAAPQQIQTQVRPLPKHVSDILLRDAETRGSTCPITMEPIKAAAAIATPCGHVFCADALAAWIASDHSTCPECRAAL